MIMHRKGENGAVPFRSGRFFNIDTDWYFACREGQNLGPFRSRGEAANALKNYLAKRTKLNPPPIFPASQPCKNKRNW